MHLEETFNDRFDRIVKIVLINVSTIQVIEASTPKHSERTVGKKTIANMDEKVTLDIF